MLKTLNYTRISLCLVLLAVFATGCKALEKCNCPGTHINSHTVLEP